MRNLKTRALATLTAMVLAGTGLAQSGSEGMFTVVNDTAGNVLVGFYTSEDAENFSDNWLAEPMMPGESGEAAFFADTGACEQYFVTGWLGADQETEVLDDIISIDICEASIVYLGDNEISFE